MWFFTGFNLWACGPEPVGLSSSTMVLLNETSCRLDTVNHAACGIDLSDDVLTIEHRLILDRRRLRRTSVGHLSVFLLFRCRQDPQNKPVTVTSGS